MVVAVVYWVHKLQKYVHFYGQSCWDAPSVGDYSSRTAWRWSTPAFPSSASEATVSSWHRPAGTTACGYSGGRSCSRWRCWSTTPIWCKAWPSLTTRTPGRGCWLLGPKTSGSACGLCSARNQRRPELLVVGWRCLQRLQVQTRGINLLRVPQALFSWLQGLIELWPVDVRPWDGGRRTNKSLVWGQVFPARCLPKPFVMLCAAMWVCWLI